MPGVIEMPVRDQELPRRRRFKAPIIQIMSQRDADYLRSLNRRVQAMKDAFEEASAKREAFRAEVLRTR